MKTKTLLAGLGQLRAKERKEEVKGGIPDATSIFV